MFKYICITAFVGFLTFQIPSAWAQNNFIELPTQPLDEMSLDRLHKLASEGQAQAQFFLALRYDEGDGIDVDMDEAIYWYRLAGEQGHMGAQWNLGVTYGRGTGVPADMEKAMYWFRKAAKSRHGEAQWILAGFYLDKARDVPDLVSGYMWLSLATFNGFNDANRFLAELETQMTPAQIAAGKERTTLCMMSGYDDCE